MQEQCLDTVDVTHQQHAKAPHLDNGDPLIRRQVVMALQWLHLILVLEAAERPKPAPFHLPFASCVHLLSCWLADHNCRQNHHAVIGVNLGHLSILIKVDSAAEDVAL